MKKDLVEENEIIEKDAEMLINQADIIIKDTIKNISFELVLMYWKLGKIICEYRKEHNSKYGDAVVNRFSEMLSFKYGRGFGVTNIKSSINFYNVFKKSPPADQFKNISWSHYREIINLNDRKTVMFYLEESINKKLTKLELRDSIKLKSYERTIINQRKDEVKNEIEKTLKDPVILNIENKKRSEKELEDEIIKNIFEFMKEIGNSVMLYGRQYRINMNSLRYKVDIVLYDKDKRYFILIDLKINKVSQKDIAQMRFDVDYFNGYIKDNKDKNTIGLVLVETKDLRVINNNDIYQIKYLNEMPKEEELLEVINENKIILLKTESLKLGRI